MIQQQRKPPLLLTSVESFCGDEKGLPNHTSVAFTISFFIFFLWMVELTLRQALISIQDFHPLLQDEIKRNILARHVGVDALSCFIISYFGWKARHVFTQMTEAALSKDKKLTQTYDFRMFQYHPEAARILTYFIGFQCKNLVDTIVWNDGPEYIAHHVLAIFSAGGGLVPGAFHFYAIFYMGISEFSTGILCLLVNFDDDHGVPGLADTFPTARAILGGLFAVSFAIIRVILWGSLTYYYFKDVRHVFQQDHPKLTSGRRLFIKLNNISLGFITLLQVVWLFEIFRIVKLEIEKMVTI